MADSPASPTGTQYAYDGRPESAAAVHEARANVIVRDMWGYHQRTADHFGPQIMNMLTAPGSGFPDTLQDAGVDPAIIQALRPHVHRLHRHRHHARMLRREARAARAESALDLDADALRAHGHESEAVATARIAETLHRIDVLERALGGLHDHPDTETQRRGREALETYRQVERAYREGRDELRFHRHRVFETMRRHQPGYGGFDPLIQPKEWLAHTYIRSLSDDTEWPNTYVPQAPAGRDR